MNKKRVIKILFLFVFLLIAWGVIWASFITRTVRKNNNSEEMKDQRAVIKNIIVTETLQEKKYWEFYAKSGEYNSEYNSVKLYDVIGNFYDKDEQVAVSFKSNLGKYDEKDKAVDLFGDILFVGKDGSELFADHIVWKGQNEDIHADGNIQFIQEGKIVSKAKKAVFNSTLTKFTILDNTITKLYANDEQKKKYTQL